MLGFRPINRHSFLLRNEIRHFSTKIMESEKQFPSSIKNETDVSTDKSSKFLQPKLEPPVVNTSDGFDAGVSYPGTPQTTQGVPSEHGNLSQQNSHEDAKIDLASTMSILIKKIYFF